MVGVYLLAWCLWGLPGTSNPTTYMARELVGAGSGLFSIIAFFEWWRRYRNHGDQENPFLTPFGKWALALCLLLTGVGIYFANTPSMP
jgi:hypothetical protein